MRKLILGCAVAMSFPVAAFAATPTYWIGMCNDGQRIQVNLNTAANKGIIYFGVPAAGSAQPKYLEVAQLEISSNGADSVCARYRYPAGSQGDEICINNKAATISVKWHPPTGSAIEYTYCSAKVALSP